MRTALRQSLMALALGLAVVSGLARGEDKPLAKPGTTVVKEAVVEGSTSAEQPRLLDRLSPGRIKDKWQNRTPWGCYGHFNDYSVGSFCSEFSFLFSGGRTFFGERCLKGPPPSPVPGFDPQALGLILPGGGVGFGCKKDGNGTGFQFGCPGCSK